MSEGTHQTELLQAIWGSIKDLDRSLNAKVDRLDTKLSAKIYGVDERLGGRIDRLETRMDGLDAKIDRFHDELKGDIAELCDQTARGFVMLSGRIDNLIVGTHGQEHAELRGRGERLERHAGLRPARRRKK